MRVQDNVLLQTAAAWDVECPSALPRLRKNNSNVANIAGAIAVACAASRRLVLGSRWGWRQPRHATVSYQAERRS
jgi:hypothetical protein